MGLLNTAIWLGYAVLTVLLYDHGTCAAEQRMRRMKYAALATASTAFGWGRFTYVVGSVPYEWLFNLGHFSFLLFGALYWWSGFERMRKDHR